MEWSDAQILDVGKLWQNMGSDDEIEPTTEDAHIRSTGVREWQFSLLRFLRERFRDD